MKSFKDHLGRIWTSCTECKKQLNGNCIISPKCKPSSGYCIKGKLIGKRSKDVRN